MNWGLKKTLLAETFKVLWAPIVEIKTDSLGNLNWIPILWKNAHQTAQKERVQRGAWNLSGKAKKTQNKCCAKLSWKSPPVDTLHSGNKSSSRCRSNKGSAEKKKIHSGTVNGVSLFRWLLFERTKQKGCVLIHFRHCQSPLSLPLFVSHALMNTLQSRWAVTRQSL